MFDIGFAELLVIAVLGLLILGPERLPVAIRTISLWVGRFKRSYRQVRTEIEKEIGADDIRRQLHNEEIMQSLKSTQEQLTSLAKDTTQELNTIHQQATATNNNDDTESTKRVDNVARAENITAALTDTPAAKPQDAHAPNSTESSDKP
ncbi:Sec-independent protein translocase protein TatB [BD1-7 clade bacterium]|uniref:Sec-independent protein translocase protein TatB n=1 Tax=BD1-7 clade bacterium TaxID=2029982 RepID=A0A5S9QCF2_9GAMM|nr:Sec-independent protein translocase protein TatB [BD1-7 clade bacterium]